MLEDTFDSAIDKEQTYSILEESIFDAIQEHALEETDFNDLVEEYGMEHFVDLLDEEVDDMLSVLNERNL